LRDFANGATNSSREHFKTQQAKKTDHSQFEGLSRNSLEKMIGNRIIHDSKDRIVTQSDLFTNEGNDSLMLPSIESNAYLLKPFDFISNKSLVGEKMANKIPVAANRTICGPDMEYNDLRKTRIK
jgi:hypothetical protein